MLAGLIESADSRSASKIPILSSATRWRSVTPFIPTRHYKKRGSLRDACPAHEFPSVVLREQIEDRGLPTLVRIELLEECTLWRHQERQSTQRSIRWLQFRRERVFGNGRRGSHPGCGFEIEFPESVSGPIALGYGCHFGLGLFAPVK